MTITSGDGSVASGVALVKSVAPSLFAKAWRRPFALRVKADGSQRYEEVVQFDAVQNRFIARPLDLGPDGDQVYLLLFVLLTVESQMANPVRVNIK